MRGTLSRCVLFALGLGLLVFPVAVHAQAAASIRPITSATLINRVAVTVQVTARCGPLTDGLGRVATGNINVTVAQASGRSVARADGFATIVCDGSEHTVPVTVIATAPMHPGPTAFISANLFACGFDQFGGFTCVNASTSGPLRLHG